MIALVHTARSPEGFLKFMGKHGNTGQRTAYNAAKASLVAKQRDLEVSLESTSRVHRLHRHYNQTRDRHKDCRKNIPVTHKPYSGAVGPPSCHLLGRCAYRLGQRSVVFPPPPIHTTKCPHQLLVCRALDGTVFIGRCFLCGRVRFRNAKQQWANIRVEWCRPQRYQKVRRT